MSRKIKIFIVDDSLVIRESLKKFLSRFDDLEIIGEASEGEEAIEILKNNHPDVVLTDILMPVMDGFEVVKWLRENRAHSKVLVISFCNEDYFVLKMCKMGVNGYFLKDDELTILPDAIRKVAGGEYFLSVRISYSFLSEEHIIKKYLQMNVANNSNDHE